jgi:pyruvate dehydrogenase E1 component beta subunit
MPATPHDAKGLMISAVEDNSPVIFLEHRWLYNLHGPVPEELYREPLGQPVVRREGGDVTIVASSYMTIDALKAANQLSEEGIEAEVIDLRTLNPLNDAPVLASVRKTGHLVVCDHATLTAGFAGEIVSRTVEGVFDALRSPPIRVTLPDCPAPTTRALANYYYPTPGHVVAAVQQTLGLPHREPSNVIAPEDRLDVPDASFTGPF